MTTPRKAQPRAIIAKIISGIFLLLAVLPFACAALVALAHLAGYGRNKLAAIVVSLAFYFVLFILLRTYRGRLSNAGSMILLFLITVLTRVISIVFFNTQPSSDFLDAINAAIEFLPGPTRSLYSARFPYWGFYRITLSAIFRVFGASVTTAKAVNVVLAGLTSALMVRLGMKISDSKNFSLAAALIFIFNPANLLYINLTSGEHFFIMLLPLTYLVTLRFIGSHPRKSWTLYLFALLAGALTGLMEMFKPVAVIILIALIITLVLSAVNALSRTEERVKRKRLTLAHGLMILLLVIGYTATKEAGFSLVEHYATVPANRYGLGWTLRVGLDIENRGRVSGALQYAMNKRYSASNEDYASVNEYLMRETAEMVRGSNASALLALFRDKFVYTWESDQDFYNWATHGQIENGRRTYDPDRLGLLVKPISDAFLFFTLLLAAAGALYCMRKINTPGPLAIGLFILGFTLVLILTEVQQRYRSVLASAIPFFAAYGLVAVKDGVDFVVSLLKKKKRIC